METPEARTKRLALEAVIFVFVLFAVVEALAAFLHLSFQDPLLISGFVLGVLRNLLLPAKPRTCVIVVESEHLESLREAVGNHPDVHFPQTVDCALNVIKTATPVNSGVAAICKILSGQP
jgi:hypothetical protein